MRKDFARQNFLVHHSTDESRNRLVIKVVLKLRQHFRRTHGDALSTPTQHNATQDTQKTQKTHNTRDTQKTQKTQHNTRDTQTNGNAANHVR